MSGTKQMEVAPPGNPRWGPQKQSKTRAREKDGQHIYENFCYRCCLYFYSWDVWFVFRQIILLIILVSIIKKT